MLNVVMKLLAHELGDPSESGVLIRLSATDKDFRVTLGAGKHARAR